MADLRETLASAKLILFDFDGPVCDVFAGLPASTIARRLEQILGERVDSDDPLRVLQESTRFGQDVVQAIEFELVRAELEAVDIATPTPGGLESMRAALNAGKSVGVLSNNSPKAIARFLLAAGLLADVTPVVGRPYGRPELMKPHQYTLQQALMGAQVQPGDVVFIGDSATDIEVALAGEVAPVALANKPGKRELFESSSPLVVDDMFSIMTCLQAMQ
ncbi:HAD family hydrolase [Amycolatopsis sp. NPDC051045]|uniref:HAD family hydrolase n=1 Tax=Amycolatopsis sp. NPDC051045 TaxID=3156922 RepID=UPI003417AEDB